MKELSERDFRLLADEFFRMFTKEEACRLIRKTLKPKITEKEAREAYAHIAVGQLKIDGFITWLKQLGVEVEE